MSQGMRVRWAPRPAMDWTPAVPRGDPPFTHGCGVADGGPATRRRHITRGTRHRRVPPARCVRCTQCSGACGLGPGVSSRSPMIFFGLGQSLRTASGDRQPPTANRHQPSTANRHQPQTIVQYCFCGFACCPCLDHEAESDPANVRFCWHYKGLFCFLLLRTPPV